jgi:hypothetical protein
LGFEGDFFLGAAFFATGLLATAFFLGDAFFVATMLLLDLDLRTVVPS